MELSGTCLVYESLLFSGGHLLVQGKLQLNLQHPIRCPEHHQKFLTTESGVTPEHCQMSPLPPKQTTHQQQTSALFKDR